jgi:hypothetical protein
VASRPTRLASCARVARASGSGSARGGRATCPPEWSLRDRQPSLGCVHHVLSSPLLHVALASATGSANASSVTCMVWGSRLTRRPAQMPQSEQAALSAADLRTGARCLLLLTPPRRCTAPCHAHFGSGAGSTCWTCAASQVTRPQPACTNVLGAGVWLFWATRPRSKWRTNSCCCSPMATSSSCAASSRKHTGRQHREGCAYSRRAPCASSVGPMSATGPCAMLRSTYRSPTCG